MLLRGGRDSDNSPRPRLGGKLVQGIAAGIGLASESYHHHQEKKDKKKQENRQPTRDYDHGNDDSYDRDYEYDYNYEYPPPPGPPPGEVSAKTAIALSNQLDEAAWSLDDAQRSIEKDGPPPYSGYQDREYDSVSASTAFVQLHPPPTIPPGRLAMPVVIPQRRPKSRERGFIRAYAPVLQDVGIDQVTFLDFLDNLNEAVTPSSWIQVINLAALATGFVPEPFTAAISAALTVAGMVAETAHSRSKTNKFLDQMNETFFKPRGLVALILTWRPESADQPVTIVDFNMNKAMQDASSGSGFRHRLQNSSAETAFDWPEMAPLIFPDLDTLVDEGSGAKNKSVMNRSGKFVQQYMDNRAQAKWAANNPDSKIANVAPKPEFHSRYADPNHPASSGDVLALLTGGYLMSPKHSLGAGVGGGLSGLASRGQQAGGGPGGLRGMIGGFAGADPRGAGIVDGRKSLVDSRFDRRLGVHNSRLNHRAGLVGGRRGLIQGVADNRYNRRAGTIDARDIPQEMTDPGGVAQRPGGRGIYGVGGGGGGGMLISGVKKFFAKDVLYLLITNMPTPEEMARGRAMMAARQG